MKIFVDNRRQATMYSRIAEAQSIVPKDFQFLPMLRNRQKRCSEIEWAKMVEIASQAEKPQNYLMSMLKTSRFEHSLANVRKILSRSREFVRTVAKSFPDKGIRFANFIADKAKFKGLSMSNLVNIIELSSKKTKPDGYLVWCVQNLS